MVSFYRGPLWEFILSWMLFLPLSLSFSPYIDYRPIYIMYRDSNYLSACKNSVVSYFYYYCCTVHFWISLIITHQQIHCYILYYSKIYIKNVWKLLHVSILRSSSGFVHCSWLKLYVKKRLKSGNYVHRCGEVCCNAAYLSTQNATHTHQTLCCRITTNNLHNFKKTYKNF
jgi:hypothetical protein